jgi:hypothetical protein
LFAAFFVAGNTVSAAVQATQQQPTANAQADRVGWLIEELKNPDLGMNDRAKAASALGEIKDARSVDPLIAALEDSSSTVRWYVVKALGVCRR